MKTARIAVPLLVLIAFAVWYFTSRPAVEPPIAPVLRADAGIAAAPVPPKKQAPPSQRSVRLSPAVVDTVAQGMSFSGRVLSRKDDAPVPDAELTFDRQGGAHSVRTAADGTFRFEPTEPGEYRLASVTAAGYLSFAPAWGESPMLFSARAGKHLRDIRLALEPAKEIVGTVVDSISTPIPGVKIQLRVPGTEELGAAATEYTSDASGKFRFIAPPGAQLEARHPDYLTGRERLTFEQWNRGVIAVMLHLQGRGAPDYFTISGKVVDMQNTPVAEATVIAVRKQPLPDPFEWSTKTDHHGAFQLSGLIASIYAVTAGAPGMVSTTQTAPSGQKNMVLRLDTNGGFITGRVSSGEGPVASFAVVITEPRGKLEELPVRTETFLDAEGAYNIGPLDARKYRVRAVAHGYATSAARDVEVVKGGRERADFELGRGGRIIGVVIDAQSKAAIAGARVTVEGRPDGDGLPIPIEASALTDGEGRFTLSGVSPGLQAIDAGAKGYNIRIVSGLKLEPEGTIGPIEIALSPVGADGEQKRELEGIGAALGPEGDVLIVRDVIAGGGGADAGLAIGDRIFAIDGQAVGDLEFPEVVQRIRGPVGTTITLSIRRGGTELQLVVTRKKIVS